MAIIEEGVHILPDKTKLYTKTWKPDGPPQAVVAFIHGFSDHCNTYYDFFPTLASFGIEVHGIDQRGWGKSVTSPGQRGLTGPTSLVLSDIHSFLQSLASRTDESTSLFLMGHSMGGAQVLYYVLNPASPYHSQAKDAQGMQQITLSGVLAFASLIALHPSSRPLGITVALGRLASKVLPRFHMRSELDQRLVSRDEQARADFAADPLCHDTGTLEGLAGMLDRASWLEKQTPSSRLTVSEDKIPPIWIGHGTADQITSFDASKKFLEVLLACDKTFQEYQGAYHKLHVEPDGVKEQLAKDVGDWILKRRHPVPDAALTQGSKPESANIAGVNSSEDSETVESVNREDKAKI
jgi:acylglycerol lipase